MSRRGSLGGVASGFSLGSVKKRWGGFPDVPA